MYSLWKASVERKAAPGVTALPLTALTSTTQISVSHRSLAASPAQLLPTPESLAVHCEPQERDSWTLACFNSTTLVTGTSFENKNLYTLHLLIRVWWGRSVLQIDFPKQNANTNHMCFALCEGQPVVFDWCWRLSWVSGKAAVWIVQACCASENRVVLTSLEILKRRLSFAGTCFDVPDGTRDLFTDTSMLSSKLQCGSNYLLCAIVPLLMSAQETQQEIATCWDFFFVHKDEHAANVRIHPKPFPGEQ